MMRQTLVQDIFVMLLLGAKIRTGDKDVGSGIKF